MYSSWNEIAVLLKNVLGFIWDLSDVFTMHILSTRAQMQSLKILPHRLSILEGWFWDPVLYKLFNDDHQKYNNKFYNKLISCLGTGSENKN